MYSIYMYTYIYHFRPSSWKVVTMEFFFFLAHSSVVVHKASISSFIALNSITPYKENRQFRKFTNPTHPRAASTDRFYTLHSSRHQCSNPNADCITAITNRPPDHQDTLSCVLVSTANHRSGTIEKWEAIIHYLIDAAGACFSSAQNPIRWFLVAAALLTNWASVIAIEIRRPAGDNSIKKFRPDEFISINRNIIYNFNFCLQCCPGWL